MRDGEEDFNTRTGWRKHTPKRRVLLLGIDVAYRFHNLRITLVLCC